MSIQLRIMNELEKTITGLATNKEAFNNIYAKIDEWYCDLKNTTSSLALPQRITKDVCNLFLSEKIKILTPDEEVNTLINSELYGSMRFNENIQKFSYFTLGLGCGVMIQNINFITGKPDNQFIPINNIIPLSFDNHDVYEIAWFKLVSFKNKNYIILTKELIDRREVSILLINSDKLLLIPRESSGALWDSLIGAQVDEVAYYVDSPRRFQWFSTNIYNIEWADTPFYQSIFWPKKTIERVEEDWAALNGEYDKSTKRIFIDSSLCKREIRFLDDNGGYSFTRPIDRSDDLFMALDLNAENAQDKIKEFSPPIRGNDFILKLNTSLKLLGQTIGLGSNFYSLDKNVGVNKTATEIIMSSREAYALVDSIKQNYEHNLKLMIINLVYLWSDLGMLPSGKDITYDNVVIEFGDGVFADDDAIKNEGIKLFERKAINRETLLKQYFNFNDDEVLNSEPKSIVSPEVTDGLF